MFELFDSLDEILGDQQWDFDDDSDLLSQEDGLQLDPSELDQHVDGWFTDPPGELPVVQTNPVFFDTSIDTSFAVPDSDMSSEMETGVSGSSNQWFDELWDRFRNAINGDGEGLLYPSDFQDSGRMDEQNGCVVVGDVDLEIHAVDMQTAQSCSLMAQEQFVERWLGHDIPEDVLEELASEWGVYTPENGTTYPGWDAVLDYFGVPHQRYMDANLGTLDQVTSANQDALITVDAREFYGDPTFPPGSGHAVAVIGKGLDPVTGDTHGYYITDSNFPGAVRLKTVEELDACWFGNMISVDVARSA